MGRGATEDAFTRVVAVRRGHKDHSAQDAREAANAKWFAEKRRALINPPGLSQGEKLIYQTFMFRELYLVGVRSDIPENKGDYDELVRNVAKAIVGSGQDERPYQARRERLHEVLSWSTERVHDETTTYQAVIDAVELLVREGRVDESDLPLIPEVICLEPKPFSKSCSPHQQLFARLVEIAETQNKSSWLPESLPYKLLKCLYSGTRENLEKELKPLIGLFTHRLSSGISSEAEFQDVQVMLGRRKALPFYSFEKPLFEDLEQAIVSWKEASLDKMPSNNMADKIRKARRRRELDKTDFSSF